MRTQKYFTLFLVITLLSVLFSDDYYEVKLAMPEPQMWQYFGMKVLISDSNAVVYAADVFNQSGLYLYRFIEGEWQVIQFIETDAGEYSNYEGGVFLDGNNLFFADNYEDDIGVFYYQFNGEFWVNNQIITMDDISDDLDFGVFVTGISNNNIIVTGNVSNEKRFYLFNYLDDIWLEDSLIGFENVDCYIQGVEMNDSTFCIGNSSCYYNNEMEDFVNEVHCYLKCEDSWYPTPVIISPDSYLTKGFGGSIYIYGEYLFISASGTQSDTDFAGKVLVYHWENDNWNLVQELEHSDSEPGDMFGTSIDGNDEGMLVISAWHNDDAGNASGSAYIFNKVETDEGAYWEEYKKICSSDLAMGDYFGNSVSISDDFVIVGAPHKDGAVGAAYIYDPHDSTLHANFTADVRNGNGPLTVQFTSVPQGNPTAYTWDFNSDGYIDSTEPHPEFTYQIDGIYSVSLTVYDETGEDVEIKEEFIQVVSDILFGDVDLNGILDVLDLMLYVNIILGNIEPTDEQYLAGDVNYSGQIDIMDIILVINEILEW